MAKTKKPASKPTAKSAKSSSAKKSTTKKTTAKKPERKSAVKPAPKKTATTAKPAAPAKAAAKAAAPKKPAPKKAPAAAPTGMPMIDTNLAAQNAAAMLLNRPTLEGTGGTPQPGKESSTFKNLKEQLANPKPTGLGNLFGPAGDQKKSGGHFNPHQEKGHNQTFGGMNKTGVPRRTNG